MSASPVSARSERNSDGFIIVAVLWILSALTALVSIYAIYVANTATTIALHDDNVVAEGLISAGVELAAYQIIAAPKDARPSRGDFAFRLGKAHIAVEFCAETARIDLNAAPKELLSGLFVVFGARPQDADEYAQRIVGWRTTSSSTQDGETSLYRQAGLSYGPRGAPFAHVAELWLVAGLPPALVERALPYLTVFSGRPEIDIRDAAPEVIAALPSFSPERLDRAQRAPAGNDAQGSVPGATTDGSDATRVMIRVDFDNGRRLAAEVVILVRDFGGDPFRILSWNGDVDAQLSRPHQRTERRP